VQTEKVGEVSLNHKRGFEEPVESYKINKYEKQIALPTFD